MVKKGESANIWMIKEKDAEAASMAHRAEVDKFLHPDRILPNVVGLAVGAKVTDGKPTGESALIVLVTQKLEKSMLPAGAIIPEELGGHKTDVMAIGIPMAGSEPKPEAFSPLALKNRVRPAKGGYSVGHKDITAGTIATGVYDILPGGKVSPPVQGIGMPPKYYILSNNHVLAASNAGQIGDAVLQPGAFDGGEDPEDRIGTLFRFVPIDFSEPRESQNNTVDCALALVEFRNIDREIYWIGEVRGWKQKNFVKVGDLVKKTGRTTAFTTGRITAVNATVDINYSQGKVARFKDQIITTSMSEGGDSGSLITTLDNVAVGLLFAGSSTVTIANQIENVRALLKVEVAEQVIN
ncbi:hypothetical protein ACSAZL_04810 [Methanosarcina sp. T3]|uniref:hypothetical protein n=1 Tax=Methanosarcina sp. T3 TaxID=3439062 RepID=UPI003F87D2D2